LRKNTRTKFPADWIPRDAVIDAIDETKTIQVVCDDYEGKGGLRRDTFGCRDDTIIFTLEFADMGRGGPIEIILHNRVWILDNMKKPDKMRGNNKRKSEKGGVQVKRKVDI
jgi:hypothetical protein